MKQLMRSRGANRRSVDRRRSRSSDPAIAAELAHASTHTEMWATTRIALEARFARAAGVHAVYIDPASNAPRSVWGGGMPTVYRKGSRHLVACLR